MSADNEGFTRLLNEEAAPGEELRAFYSEIATPLLADVDVMYRDDVVDRNSIIRHGSSNFYSGSEVSAYMCVCVWGGVYVCIYVCVYVLVNPSSLSCYCFPSGERGSEGGESSSIYIS